MLLMILFGINASKKSNYLTPSGVVVNRSFFRFEVLFPLVLFAIVFGMRYDVGVDHLGYLYGYLEKIDVGKGEPLFQFLSKTGWYLNLHYTVYFGIIAFIQVFFFFYAFKNERYLFPLLVFLLFTNNEWTFWMNGIRQALAMCVWVFSIKYIENKKLWKYIIWCVIAALFHRSAIILVVFYPILKNGKDYFKNIPLQLLLLTCAFLIQSVFSNIFIRLEPLINSYASIIGGGAYSSYGFERIQESFVEPEGTGLAYLFRLLLNVVVIFYSKRLKLFYNNKRFTIIYFFFIVGIIIQNIFPVGLIAITRPFRYLYIFQTIMYAFFLYYLYKTKLFNNTDSKSHTIMYYGLIIIFCGIFYLSIITSNQDASTWYQFYFEKNIYGYPN